MIKFIEKNRYISIALTIMIAIEIFFISSIPGFNIKGGGFDLSSGYHVIVFFLLNFFLLVSVMGISKIKKSKIFLIMLASIIYAITDELHQIIVPLRSASIGDFLLDSIGIFSSTFLYLYSKKFWRKKG